MSRIPLIQLLFGGRGQLNKADLLTSQMHLLHVGLVATAVVAASVTASALALSTSIQTTQTINELSMTVTTALDKQATANSQIQGGLLLINRLTPRAGGYSLAVGSIRL